MSNPLYTFLELISPIILGFFLIISLFYLKKDSENVVSFTFYNVINLKLPIKNIFIIRLCILTIVLFLWCIPAFKDYSKYFVSSYEMEVFFDNNGIEKSLQDFSDEEIISFNISNVWKNEKNNYFEEIDKKIVDSLGLRNFFNPKGDYLYSKGFTTFFVKKIKGWQLYYIKEAHGILTHYLEKPNEPVKQFVSEFNLQITSNNYIHAKITDIYFKHAITMSPEFKQILRNSPKNGEIVFHHLLKAVTKVRFFPIIKIGNTIYFAKSKDNFHFIPIGYAIYKPI